MNCRRRSFLPARERLGCRVCVFVEKESGMKDLTGKAAVPFTLSDSNGQVRRLEDFRGHWLLLMFHRHLG